MAEGGGIIAKVAKAIFKLVAKDAGKAAERDAAKTAERDAAKTAEQDLAKSMEKKATAPVDKFDKYIFKDGATHGKDHVFRSYGYGKEDSKWLADEYERQAAERYAAGDFRTGKLDQYGQRVTIPITLEGKGPAVGRSTRLSSGWMVNPDGTLKLTTPFAGFYDG